MRKKSVLVALALLVAGAGTLAPIACDGGAGLAVLTVGVSLLFIGASPGWALRDPDVSGGPRTIEPAIHVGTAGGDEGTVERVIFLGGELRSPVIVEGRVTAQGSATTATIELLLRRADGNVPVPVSSTTINATTSGVSFREALSFSQTPTTRSFPGDVAFLRISTPGDIEFDTKVAVVDAKVRVRERVPLTIAATGIAAPVPGLFEEPPQNATPFDVPAGSSVTAKYFLTALSDALYDIAGDDSQSSSPGAITYSYEGTPEYSLVLETTQAGTEVSLQLFDTDVQSFPVRLLATAGPIRLGAGRQRVSGEFQPLQQPFWAPGTTSSAPAERALALVIENAGPGGVTVVFNPAGGDASVVRLPAPRARALLGGQIVELSQPPPR